MRRLAAAALSAAFVLTLLAPAVARAADPPSNDDYLGAKPIASFPFSDTVATSGAGWESGEKDACSAGGGSAHSLWYSFVSTSTASITVSASGPTAGQVQVASYYLQYPTNAGFAQLSDGRCYYGSPATLPQVTPLIGKTFYIQVIDTSAAGSELRLQIAKAPSNDPFADAKPVGTSPWTDTVPLYAATTETNEPNACGIPSTEWAGKRTVWYRFDATAEGELLVETTQDAAGAEARIVPFMDGGWGWNGTTAGGCSTGPSASFPVVGGHRYWIQIVNYMGQGMLDTRFTFTGVPGPMNDDLANAEQIVSFPYTGTPVDISHATSQTGELALCGMSSRTVWYTFVAPSNGTATVSATATTFSDAYVAVYRASGTTLSDLSYLTCAGGGGWATVGIEEGAHYFVQAADSGSGGGMLTVSVSVTSAPPPPPNDAFASATPIDTLPFADHGRVVTGGATSEADEPHDCGGSNRTVWYRFDATAHGTLTVTTAPSTGFWDHPIAAYQQGGTGLTGLTSVRCTGWDSALLVQVRAGRTYYVQVSDTFSGGGTLDVDFTFAEPPANDDLADAQLISTFPSDISVDLSAATGEAGEPGPCSWDPAPRTIWYVLDPSTDGVVSVVPSGLAPGLAAYAATGPGMSGLKTLTNSTWSSLLFRAQPGTTYYVQASSCGSPGNFYGFTVAVTPAAANDNIALAKVLTDFPSSDSVATAGASLEPGEDTPCASSTSRTVWYAYTPTVDGALVVNTARSTAWYLVVNVYTSPGIASTYGDLSLAVCSNYGRTPIRVQAGTTYYIQIADYGSPGGMLNVDFDFATRAPNDDFADAVVATGAMFTHSVDTRAATLEAGEPYGGSERSVWYRFASPVSGVATIDPTASSFGDVKLTLYRSVGPGFAGLRYAGAAWGAPLTPSVIPGETYFIQATDWGGGGGVLRLAFNLPAPAISGVESPYAVDARITITGSVTDTMDPRPSVTCTLAGPSGTSSVSCAYATDAWSLGALGTYTFTARATDAAGNTATATATFDVVATYPSVRSLTSAWTKKASVAKDLMNILDSAYAAEQRGQYTAEANKLKDYRAAVRAQSGKAIDADKADLLITFSSGL